MAAQQETSSPQPQIYKKQPKTNRALPSSLGMTRALANGVAGIANALASGIDAFQQKLTDENITALNLENGFVLGSVAANTRFLEELAKISQQVYEDLRMSVAEQTAHSRRDVDYDSLATLVAEKLRQRSQPEGSSAARPPPSGRTT